MHFRDPYWPWHLHNFAKYSKNWSSKSENSKFQNLYFCRFAEPWASPNTLETPTTLVCQHPPIHNSIFRYSCTGNASGWCGSHQQTTITSIYPQCRFSLTLVPSVFRDAVNSLPLLTFIVTFEYCRLWTGFCSVMISVVEKKFTAIGSAILSSRHFVQKITFSKLNPRCAGIAERWLQASGADSTEH